MGIVHLRHLLRAQRRLASLAPLCSWSPPSFNNSNLPSVNCSVQPEAAFDHDDLKVFCKLKLERQAGPGKLTLLLVSYLSISIDIDIGSLQLARYSIIVLTLR